MCAKKHALVMCMGDLGGINGMCCASYQCASCFWT